MLFIIISLDLMLKSSITTGFNVYHVADDVATRIGYEQGPMRKVNCIFVDDQVDSAFMWLYTSLL